MGRHKRFFIKCMFFLLALILCVLLVNRILMPKAFRDNMWPTTATYLGFYEMEKDSVDVLWLGSSHGAAGFIPQRLYDQYQITSYNLSCEHQNMVVTYYWLKEALKSQTPKLVVLDTYMLFECQPGEALNGQEACTRKAMDYMHFDEVKWEAVNDICRLDEKQKRISYYMPNIRFHERWESLEEDDFVFYEMCTHYELKGYAPLLLQGGSEAYAPYEPDETAPEGETVPLMEEYFYRINELCGEQNIPLLLVKTPAVAMNVQRNRTLYRIADTCGLTLYDLNEKERYEAMNFAFATDMNDDGHANVNGAEKITDYIGEKISAMYGLQKKEDPGWQKTASFYEGTKASYRLCHEEDLAEYLSRLKNDRFTVFMAVQDEGSMGLSEEAVQGMKALGLKPELQGGFRKSYLAICGTECFEQCEDRLLTKEGTIRAGRVRYQLVSGGNEWGNTCSIMIDGTEYALKQRGLNIVVYDNVAKKVIDQVCFDTCDPKMQAYRDGVEKGE